MSTVIKCPQCGASDPNLLQDNLYQCKFCSSIYEDGDKSKVQPQIEINIPKMLDGFGTKKLVSKIIRFAVVMFLIPVVIFIAAVFFTSKNQLSKFTGQTSTRLFKDYSESSRCFTVVNANIGPEVWVVSKWNSDGLKEVSYKLNKVDPEKNKVITSSEIGKKITWNQSLTDDYRMNDLYQMGKICWLIYGNKLIGYDVNTQIEIENNETIKRKFPKLNSGIAKVENVYNVDGFKLTTNDGYIFYYMPTLDKLFTEKEYDDKSYLPKNYEDKIEYYFTDGERQQLYKVSKKAGKEIDVKLTASTVSFVLKNNTDWYRKMYKINSMEEFTPNEIYFNANVLYSDDNKVIIIYQKALGAESPIYLTCLDAQNKEMWTKVGSELEMLKPFLKSSNEYSFSHGNQAVLIQSSQIAVCVNMNNGEIIWSFKPY